MENTAINWGLVDETLKSILSSEIFDRGIYEKFFEVEEGDIVLDLGSSVGPFAYSILSKKPAKIICVEPSPVHFPILVENTQGFPVVCINSGIASSNQRVEIDAIYGAGTEFSAIVQGITLDRIVFQHELQKIDFIKTDCEGGEYDVFTEEFLPWIKKNVGKIAGEWHLSSPHQKIKFRKFRDSFLSQFNNYLVTSVDGVDITWDLWNDHFLEYYNQVLIYIDNRQK